MITVIGDTTLDVITSTIQKLPLEDTETNCTFKLKLGGQAAHTALGLAKLGLDTQFCSMIGKDNYGDIIINKLKKEKGLHLHLQRKGTTGLSFIVSTEFKRTIFNDNGANALFSNVPEINGKFLFIGGYWHLQKLNLLQLLKTAKRKGMTTFLDVGYSENPSRKKLFSILKYVDYCFLDKKELFMITQEKDFFKALNLIPSTVILHLAEKGSGLVQNGKLLVVPTKKVSALDTTGAGDFWNAGFIYGIIKQWPLKKVLDFSNQYAVKCLRGEIHNL